MIEILKFLIILFLSIQGMKNCFLVIINFRVRKLERFRYLRNSNVDNSHSIASQKFQKVCQVL